MRKLTRFFPTYSDKNIKLYYLITVFSSAWFIIGNWLFFALRYITAYQMSILEAVSFGFGLLLEIPSGAIADLLGKKRTLQIGLLMQTVGMVMFTLADISRWLLIIGNIIIISSFAMISGSFEALAYDSLVENKKEDKYDVIAGRIGVIHPVIFTFTAIIGGLLWRASIYLPWVVTSLSFFSSFDFEF